MIKTGLWLVGCLMAGATLADGWSLGVGATFSPEYPGAEQWRVLPAPTFSVSYQGLSLQTRGPGLVADIVPSDRFSAGPLIRYSGGRDEAFLGSELSELDTIAASAEAGVSLSTGLPLFLVSDALPGILTVSVDWITALPGGYEGSTLNLGTGWIWPVTERITLISTLGVTYQDEAYAEQWFSVNEGDTQSLDSFSARAGFNDTQAGLISSYRFNDHWSMALIGVASRYQGDAARSPVTRLTNSRQRYLVVWGLSYRSQW